MCNIIMDSDNQRLHSKISFRIKPKRAMASKYTRTPSKSKNINKLNINNHKYKEVPSTKNGTSSKSQTGGASNQLGLYNSIPAVTEGEVSSFNKQFPNSSLSNRKRLTNPLDLGFDANEELRNCYEQHIARQEETISKLSARIDRLEEVHSSATGESELLKLQTEGAELRATLTEAQSAIHGERRLVAALHADNTKLKLELLQTSQRAVSLQIISGISESRVEALQGTELVRSKMPEKLRKLQQKLWSQADHGTATGNVSPESLLSLQHRVRTAEESLSYCEAEWAQEKESLVEESELREQEAELDQARVTAWVNKAQERVAECQQECRSTSAQCVRLTQELQLQQKQHVQERAALLRALAKLGGPERLRQELESLDVSSRCLSEATGHASSSCQARELKLLTLQLQRELSECQQLLQESQGRADGLQKEKCILTQAREEALSVIKRQRSSASEHRQLLESQQERSHQLLKTELQATQADLSSLHSQLKKLVHMIYKLTVWQSDQCSAGSSPPSPPPWLEGPRAVATLARKLQAALEASRSRLAGVRSTMLRHRHS